MSSTTLPRLNSASKRNSSLNKLDECRKVKTLASQRNCWAMDVVLQAKLRLGKERANKKLPMELKDQLERHQRRQQMRHQNEMSSSDEEKEVIKELENGSDPIDSNALKATPRMLNKQRVHSLYTERAVSLEKEPLVGKEAVSRFYNVHKSLDKVEEQELLSGKLSTITWILRLLEDLHIPPKKLEFIKESGDRSILDLKNCGLGKGNGAVLLHEILTKIGNFDTLDISHNSIHLDVVGQILPFVGKVRYVDVSQNRINSEGCSLLGKLFQSSDTIIERLEVEANDLSDLSGVELLRNILGYPKLKILNLSRNYLSKQSGIALSRYLLSPSTSIVELYLHWNELNEEASPHIFEALSTNTSVRVLDFSWNYQRKPARMLPALKKFLQTNKTCVHLDLSYCCFMYEHSRQIKKSLSLNNTIFGIHFEGNHGHIDSRGNLILEDRLSNLSDMVQYPMPLHKSVARRIRGCLPCHEQQQFGVDQKKNICWLCSDYQEFEFRLPKPFGMSGTQCFVHLDREYFRGFKLLEKDNEFFVKKMLPRGHHRFFFTLGRDYRLTSEHYPETKEGIFIEHFKIGKVKFTGVPVPKLNVIDLQTHLPVLDPSDYQPNVECRPRQKLSRINLKNLVLRKRLIERLEKMKFSLKELPQVVEFRPSQQQQTDVFRKCVEYDFENSKLPTILAPDTHKRIKEVLFNYYREIWCTFDWLSSQNATEEGIFTVSQQAIIDFAQEVKYVTKRIPVPKILVKYVSSLRKDGTMRRPQFVEFLLRLAEEKWARQDKTYFKSSFHQLTVQQVEARKSISKESIRKKSESLRKDSFKIDLIRQESNAIDEQQRQVPRNSNALLSEEDRDESETKSIGKREREALPIDEALDRVLKPLVRYYTKYNPEDWRRNRYMTPDIRLLLDAYQPFLQKLFEKYAKIKVYNRRKTVSYYDFVTMFMKAGIVANRSKFDEGQRAFVLSRILEVNESNGFSLGYEELNECLARVAEAMSFPPIGFSDRQLFRNEKPRIELPVVFKMESLLNVLYRGHPQLSAPKLSSMFEDGIFKEEIETYIEIATERYMKEPDLILEPKINTRIKFNNLAHLTELTLKDLIEALKLKYSNMMIRRYSVVQELQEEDEDDEDPPE